MNASQLYALARTQLARPDAATDPVDVAAAMTAQIADHDLRSSLRAALPLIVRRVLGERTTRSAGAHLRQASGSVNGTPKLLDQVVCASPGRWKPLRDCTRSELEGMAAFRRQLSKQHAEMATQYERLARQMAERRLQTAGEVSDDHLTTVLPA